MLAELVRPLREIPRRDEDFDIPTPEATRQFGCDAEVLDTLRDAGLARPDQDGMDRFAYCDLHYIGLRTGTAGKFLWAMRQWVGSLDSFADSVETHAHIAFLPQLGDGRETLSGSVIVSEEGPRPVLLRARQPAGEVEVTLRGDYPGAPDFLGPLLDEVAAMEFCRLPDHACGDIERARGIGAIDCWTAALMIIDGCHQAGLEAHLAEGFIVSVPFSSPHMWAEVRIDGIWTPIDPLMVSALQRFAGADPRVWTPRRSLGPLLARIIVTSEPLKLVRHAGRWVETTFLTRLVEAVCVTAIESE